MKKSSSGGLVKPSAVASLDVGEADVLRGDRALRAQHLDALVVAVGGAARVGDGALAAGGGAQDDVHAVEVAAPADLGVDQNGGGGEHGLHLLAEQPAGHVEVVDRHVAEDAARALDVVVGRRAGVARGQRHHLDRTDPAVVDRGLQRVGSRGRSGG
jgi:hypothetical protein